MDSSFLGQLIPVFAAGLIAWLVLLSSSVFFVPRQRERGFTMVTTSRVVALVTLSALTVTAVEAFSSTQVSLGNIPVLIVSASLLYLLGVTILTDFSSHKIPNESAWLPAVIGVPAFAVAFFGGYLDNWSLGNVFVLIVLAVLPLVAFLSVLFSGGGAADYRVAMSGFLATFWWVLPGSIFVGLIAFIVFTIVGRVFFSKKLESGRTMTPAGPAYVSLFVFAAIYSLVFI